MGLLIPRARLQWLTGAGLRRERPGIPSDQSGGPQERQIALSSRGSGAWAQEAQSAEAQGEQPSGDTAQSAAPTDPEQDDALDADEGQAAEQTPDQNCGAANQDATAGEQPEDQGSQSAESPTEGQTGDTEQGQAVGTEGDAIGEPAQDGN